MRHNKPIENHSYFLRSKKGSSGGHHGNNNTANTATAAPIFAPIATQYTPPLCYQPHPAPAPAAAAGTGTATALATNAAEFPAAFPPNQPPMLPNVPAMSHAMPKIADETEYLDQLSDMLRSAHRKAEIAALSVCLFEPVETVHVGFSSPTALKAPSLSPIFVPTSLPFSPNTLLSPLAVPSGKKFKA